MRTLEIDTAEVFEPLLEPARYKAAYGGRGSGKSYYYTDESIEDAVRWPGDAGEGLRQLEIREIQKSLKQSSKFLFEKKLKQFGLGEPDGFKIYTDRISTPGDGVIEFQGMQDHTADTIKSYEGFHKARVEEAQTLSATSLSLLRPTIRWENERLGMASSLAFSWNPRRKVDPVDRLFRGPAVPSNSIVVRANWSDNPWFPKVLEQERQDCLRDAPEEYEHIWEGGYANANAGAYFARQVLAARQEGRIGVVARDPLLPVRAYWDIGFSDACCIWIVQFVGAQIRVLDHYVVERQALGAHLQWLRDNKYGNALCKLPHDGSKHDLITGTRYEDHIREAGFEVETIPNQGKGAAMKRIEAVRRIFPSLWFNEKTCEAGIDALGWYHERHDEKRNVGLGPEHDWASHDADAFGLMAIDYEGPEKVKDLASRDRHRRNFYGDDTQDTWVTA